MNVFLLRRGAGAELCIMARRVRQKNHDEVGAQSESRSGCTVQKKIEKKVGEGGETGGALWRF